jgi:hypothetical protein
MGLMQIMPGTWLELRSRYHFGVDPYDPQDNIVAGTAYIHEFHERYVVPGFLAADNAGLGRYQRDLATGRPLPDETLAYVAALAPIIEGKPASGKTVTVARAFGWTTSPFLPRVPRATLPTIGRQMSCIQITCQDTALSSILRRLRRGRAACSRIM